MRILCDHNVAGRYTDTFSRTDWITVTTAADALSPRAADAEIANYAARHGWVVFTEDDDFFALDADCGVVLYHQQGRPSPGTVVDVLGIIADAYADHAAIETRVPGEWR